MKEVISELFTKVGLGEIIGDINSVPGGLMHKMYKVCSASGEYAVKCLNPEIMKRPGVFENYAAAEELEDILELNDIPIVPALSFDKKKMIETSGRYFYIYRWLEGSITDFDNISAEQCFTVGSILGRIHAIDSHDTEVNEPEICNIDFNEYVSVAKAEKSNIGDLIGENRSLLEKAQDKLNDARKNLPTISVIDNPDMDPKNIIWNEGKAYVIDLECLERGNPASGCINLAMQWAGTVTEKYNSEKLRAFFDGYLKEYDNGYNSYDKLYGITYTWLEWLEYNLRRALGMEGSEEEEIRLGEEEVKNTIGRIRYLNEIEDDVCNVLKGIK